ncbi:spore germination protein [Alicyclobacillus acidoterrestris]|uniref:Spore germination protein n=1 Tax=Alicyclobacillus acidoterrestris (strain ATCC 49025 / DSM 3922 / CIP 106132 / NCIMB 13137 / GD3B) TaxID=1356854 RepID=T0BGC7_ALIAG|nr:spore germination protein [Alicyclobacillus acidoterrestris]EPZ43023.1 hypothetical protein N007_01400 [Alicyclobacillus acidoterrestris ATCC 49025]UNO49817.1 spore germination protein [Alicyclobacillus acidoterrestris]
MTIFQRWVRNSGFTNQVKGRNKPNVPPFEEAPDYEGNLNRALAYFSNTVGLSDDYMVRVTQVNGRSAVCLFVNTICDSTVIEKTLNALHVHRFPRKEPKNLPQYLIERVFIGSDAVFMENLYEIREALTEGSLVFLIDGASSAIVIGATYVEHRAPQEPYIETSSRGSQVSFVENVDVNVGLLRRNLTTDSLVVKHVKVGYRTRRKVAIAFVRDVANPTLVETVVKRIDAIHIGAVDDAAAVEQRISDHPWSLFPMTRTTQRIDNAVREVNQGKVCIMVDGDPTVLLAPATLQDFFQTQEDFQHPWWEATAVRWLRIISFFFAVYLPALYVAFVDFNPELLPKVMALQIAESREHVPFPAVLEVFIMMLVVEILREATLRMPRQMGQTIGIVGGLVVGQAAVEAGIVSNVLIIVISLTSISVFVSPSYEFAICLRLGSWAMVIAATIVGFYGVVLLTIWIWYEVANLKSFGVSYLDPFGGEYVRDTFVDGIIRLPITVLDKRASHLRPIDEVGGVDTKLPLTHPQLDKSRRTSRYSRGRKS